MAGRNYERLPIEQFGKQLLITGDLDPVYIALKLVDWDEDQVKRWLVAYWCLYHCGTASYLSAWSGDVFFTKLAIAAHNTVKAPTGGRWDRGAERRHWRGQQAVSSCEELTKRYGNKPEDMVNYIMEGAPDFLGISNRVQEHRGFGNWIGFKVADMVDRVLLEKVDFTEAAVFMFKDPTEAALKLWRLREKLPDNTRPKDKKMEHQIIHRVVGHLETAFAGMTAPPAHDRPVELQEIETILCKWKSHLNGHYPLFNDIVEISIGVSKWKGCSPAANQFLNAMPLADPE